MSGNCAAIFKVSKSFYLISCTDTNNTTAEKPVCSINPFSAHLIYTNLFAVFRVGEVNEVIIVHFLGVDDVTVLLLTQVLGVDAVGSQELLVGHAERLADGLSNELSLKTKKKSRNHYVKHMFAILICGFVGAFKS